MGNGAGIDWRNWWHWTYEDILRLVEDRQFEPGRFDFKAAIKGEHANRNDLQRSIRQTACGMTNSETGGQLIFGVLDHGTKKSPVERVIGFRSSGDLRKELGDVLEGIQPAIEFDTSRQPIPVPNSENVLFVADIPSSLKGPHMADGRFLIRKAGGSNVDMNWEQISDRMRFNHERCAALVRLRILVSRVSAEAAAMKETGGITFYARLRQFDAASLRSAVDLATVAIYMQPQLIETLQTLVANADEISGVIRYCFPARGADAWARKRYEDSMPLLVDASELAAKLIDEILHTSGCRFQLPAVHAPMGE